MQNLILLINILISLYLFTKHKGQVSWWFLFNGLWIHIYLDGIVGLWQYHDFLFAKYSELDQRYPLQESTVRIISMIEFFFMGPMCTLIGIMRPSVLREFLIGGVSMVQVMGTIIFVYDEYSRDFMDVCYGDCYRFDAKNIFYFWIFFVLANPVWICL